MVDIIKAPNPILNTICIEVDPTDNGTHALAEELVETMISARGQGLAAPQIGLNLRVFCMKYGGGSLVLCNPKITRRGNQMVTDIEGCLSIPGVRVRVTRHKIIEVQFTTLDGESKKLKLRNMDARCAQHEIDHLNGVLIA